MLITKYHIRKSLGAALLLAVALSSSLSAGAAAPETGGVKSNETTPAATIRVAPPAPVFDDKVRVAELVARRARVAQEIGPKGILILFSAEPRIYSNSVDYEYRQENNFYYLTHLKQQGATLVLLPGHDRVREILFLPKRNPARETWDGNMYSAEDAQKLSGVGEIWEAREFEPFLKAIQSRQPYVPKSDAVLMSATKTGNAQAAAPSANASTTTATATGYENLFAAMNGKESSLFLLVPAKEAEKGEFGDSREWRREQKFATEWKQAQGTVPIRSAFAILNAMRLRKSPSEIQRLQHAIDITSEAFGRAMAAAGRAQWEYEVEAEVEYTFKRRNADYWGYPSIVGCGPNATTLHYNASQGKINRGDLLLMDVGAEYDHYTADITRTFPVSGKFTKEQTDIYNIVLAAQEAGMRATRPGGKKGDVHKAATEVIKDGLLKLGLITDRNSNQHRVWFMHGTSHWLGMNVHDVGDDNAVLEPGMVFTNEPGIYIRNDALEYLDKTPENEKFIAAVRPAFEKYKNVGVRIEDDILVTTEGYRNLSVAIPRTVTDIEAFIARASRELRLTAIDAQPGPAPANQAVGMFDVRSVLTGGVKGEVNSLWNALAPSANLNGRT
ncbi:MAG TPA: aminopeptidase P family protein, partial [Pyrinomonadaceae bacterium]|nr:aminopeptidase P family protein [Pyrinomonadaceae bacterium]